MVEKLITSLRALAATSEAQLVRFPEFVRRPDDLALEFADALLMVSDCPQVLLTEPQRRALQAVDDQLFKMSGEANAHLWRDGALTDSDEWATVRRLAVMALTTLGFDST